MKMESQNNEGQSPNYASLATKWNFSYELLSSPSWSVGWLDLMQVLHQNHSFYDFMSIVGL